ncbi:MAG: hypothetical protein WBX38_06350 [Candidatus Sulfotelmatobacter sp.]
MSKTKLETAKELAKAHFANEPRLQHVYLLEPLNEADPREPIKLLEVVEGTIERGVEPIAFPVNRGLGIDYPVWIIEVSPREYDDKQVSGSLHGHGWRVGDELTAT